MAYKILSHHKELKGNTKKFFLCALCAFVVNLFPFTPAYASAKGGSAFGGKASAD
jgi:hypothetical protein